MKCEFFTYVSHHFLKLLIFGCTGSSLLHVGSSQTKDWTHVLCVDSQIQWTTREIWWAVIVKEPCSTRILFYFSKHRWHSGKESACPCRRHKRGRFNAWVRKILWSRKWQPTSVFLPGSSHGQRSLAGYSPRGRKELDTTEHWRKLNFYLEFLSIHANLHFLVVSDASHSEWLISYGLYNLIL